MAALGLITVLYFVNDDGGDEDVMLAVYYNLPK